MNNSNLKDQIAINIPESKANIAKGLFKYIRGFSLVTLKAGNALNMDTGDCECAILVLSGKCDMQIDGKLYRDLGRRASVFSGLPAGIYVPMNKKYTLSSSDKAQVAVCLSACDRSTEFCIVTPDKVKVNSVGKGNWQREVHIILGQDSPAVNLLLGETINPPGNWSGTPAHKHEKNDPPDESLHEELYYFKTDRPQGFGIQRTYSPERDINELIYLQDNTVTYMPWGYHQIAAGPGYTLYYLFFLSGEGKGLTGNPDPSHKWINE